MLYRRRSSSLIVALASILAIQLPKNAILSSNSLPDCSSRFNSDHSMLKKCYTFFNFSGELWLSLQFWRFSFPKVLYCCQPFCLIVALASVLAIQLPKSAILSSTFLPDCRSRFNSGNSALQKCYTVVEFPA